MILENIYIKKMFYIVAVMLISTSIRADYYYDAFNNKVEFQQSSNYLAFIASKKELKLIDEYTKKEGIEIISKDSVKEISIIKIEEKNLLSLKYFLIKNNIKTLNLTNDKYPIIFPDEILIQFKNGSDNPYFLKEKFNFEVIKYIKPIDCWVIKANDDSVKLSNQLIEGNYVLNAQPDLIIAHKKRFTPNDTFFSKQWHLNDLGKNGSIGGADIKAIDAWDLELGNPEIIISIVDDGMDIKHPDLKDKIIDSYDFADDDNDVMNEDKSGDDHTGYHGTACAGVAAATGDNEIGVVGSCPNCSLISARIGLGQKISRVSADADAIIWSAGGKLEGLEKVKKPASIINNSWGFSVSVTIPLHLKKAIDYAVDNGRNGKGVVVIFAAGNENRRFGDNEIEGYDKVIAVGASNDRELRSNYSNYGKKLVVIAPSSGGVNNIITTDYQGSLGYNRGRRKNIDKEGDYTDTFGGTSSAAPLVSGIVGLILSKNNDLKWNEVKSILMESADQIGDLKYKNGRNDYYGYGRVNAFNALKLADWKNYNDISKKCEIQSDCNFNCLPNEIDWKDGYCSKECSANYCPSNNLACVRIDNIETPQCLKKCDNITDCREGYVCNNLNEEDYKYCMPSCTITGCEKEFQICDKNLNICVIDVENKCWDKNTNKPKVCQKRASCEEETGDCICGDGYIDNGDGVCTKNLCVINGKDVVCIANSTCEGVTGLCICDIGYKDEKGRCVSKDEGICSYGSSSNISIIFLLFLFLFFIRRKKI